MSLTLTPEMLAAGYSFLATTHPFCKWNLPDADDVKFVVDKDRKRYGAYRRDKGGRHIIYISSINVGFLDTFNRTMAHEIIHLHMEEVGMDSSFQEHSEAFWKLANQVCRIHGFDPKAF